MENFIFCALLSWGLENEMHSLDTHDFTKFQL